MGEREQIAAELRRRVLVEAGHRCAIPTCRQINVDVHHIVPWEQCKKHEYENLIALCPNCHRMAHKNEIDRRSLYLYKMNLRFSHDRFSQLEVDILFQLASRPNEQFMWAEFNLLLLKRVLDVEYVVFRIDPQRGVFIGGMMVSPVYIQITPKGLAFIQSLGEVEL